MSDTEQKPVFRVCVYLSSGQTITLRCTAFSLNFNALKSVIGVEWAVAEGQIPIWLDVSKIVAVTSEEET